MAQEIVIHTWCDIEYSAEGAKQKRIDAKTITWFIEGQRMEIDLCPAHEEKTPLGQMDSLVHSYGRPWTDPNAPVKTRGPYKKKSKSVPPEEVPIDHGHWDGEKRAYFCTAPDCPKKGQPYPKLQGFRMHQRQTHLIGVPSTDK